MSSTLPSYNQKTNALLTKLDGQDGWILAKSRSIETWKRTRTDSAMEYLLGFLDVVINVNVVQKQYTEDDHTEDLGCHRKK